jgi:hypothetical protein
VVGAFTEKEVLDPQATMPEGWDTEEDGEWKAPTIENPALTAFNEIVGSPDAYGYRFAVTFDPDVLAKLKAKNGGLFLFRSPRFLSPEHGDRPRERYPSTKLEASGVTNWLGAKAQPLVGLFSSATRDRYRSPTLVIFMNLDFEANAKGVAYVLKRARKAVSGALKGKNIKIGVADLNDFSYELGDYGLESKSAKSDVLMGIVDKANDNKYGAQGIAFTGASLQKFAEDFLAGKLEPHKMPEASPSDDTEGDDSGDDDLDSDNEHDEP